MGVTVKLRMISNTIGPISAATKRPVFRNSRVPLYQIIEELADGTPLESLPQGYPSVSLEQIQAGLDFVALLVRIYDDD